MLGFFEQMSTGEMVTSAAGLLISAVIIPWLVYVTKQLQHISRDTKWLTEQHMPDTTGTQAWKNPGVVEAVQENTRVLRELAAILGRREALLEQLAEYVKELRQHCTAVSRENSSRAS